MPSSITEHLLAGEGQEETKSISGNEMAERGAANGADGAGSERRMWTAPPLRTTQSAPPEVWTDAPPEDQTAEADAHEEDDCWDPEWFVGFVYWFRELCIWSIMVLFIIALWVNPRECPVTGDGDDDEYYTNNGFYEVDGTREW